MTCSIFAIYLVKLTIISRTKREQVVKHRLFSTHLISSQQHVQYQKKPLAAKGNYEGRKQVGDESIQGVSAVTFPVAKHYHFADKAEGPIPLESKEKMEETAGKGATPCNVENVEVNVPKQPQNEDNNNNDDDVDDLSAKDLLCLAWQIAQGMVSGECMEFKKLFLRNVYWLIQ